MSDWLSDFVAHTSYGEAPPKVMLWVGIATIAGALRRKVYIDEDIFQWSPNFYLLIVAKPGVVKKSTSIGLGLRLLKKVEGIDFGPQMVTWQQMVTHMADAREEITMPDGKPFEMSCCTIGLSEFGSFFKKDDDDMITQLTDMWDGKIETVVKETKTNGNDYIVNPWLNIMACCTPDWITKNFSGSLIGEGFGSRPIYLYAETPTRFVTSPRRNMMQQEMSPDIMAMEEDRLVEGLREFAALAGEFHKTEEAFEWEEIWYPKYMEALLQRGSAEASIGVRRQTHLNKVAMVLSVSRGKFPRIDVQEMIDADMLLTELEEDTKKVFGYVGQSVITAAARDIVGLVAKTGKISRRKLYRDYFFRTMKSTDFDEAIRSAKASGMILEGGAMDNPTLEIIARPE